jgi:transposase/predicted nucleic acid-binding Zn finger protein
MEPRKQRGLIIAAVAKITRKDDAWIVPSQSGNGKYTVHLGNEKDYTRCTCPDYETNACKCKHIFAVEFALLREQNADGSTTVTEKVTITATKRTTYKQKWPAYNAAQTNEKHQFQILLRDLCSGIENPPHAKGRRPLPLSDAVFAVTFKIYSTFSGRRFISDLTDAHAKGYISELPHYNSIFNYLENPALSPILTNLITQSSLPLKAVESDFAVDSTGFTTSRFVRWFDHKYGVVRQEHDWVKCHLMCGVKTNIVTAVEIHDRDASDTKILPSLVEATAKNFELAEVSADKGYSSINNTKVIASHGAIPFIAFKSIHTGAGGGLWGKMYHFFQFNRSEFLAHYHKRSNIESTINMIKAKFRDHVRSKTDVAMKNEVLCKVLCHNICCLIQATYELGIDPDFSVNGHSNRMTETRVPESRFISA